MIAAPPDVDAIRAAFPALRPDFAHLENAGGSQLPGVVIDAVARFMRESYVQTGGLYPDSVRATETAAEAHRIANLLMNGEGIGHVAMGQSTTALLHMLAGCWAARLVPGDEIVVSVANHESHIGPWVRLEKMGIRIVWWGVDPESGLSDPDELAQLLSPKTRLVAFPRTSNLVGDVQDVRRIADLAHSTGARVVVDAVASASHEPLDVAAWNADFCVVSHYKIYGPHMASLFGTVEAWAELDGPNHFFLPDKGAYKFELGCLSYEGCAALVALPDYLRFLIGEPRALLGRELFERGFRRMSELELPLKHALIGGLRQFRDVRVLGETDPSLRHPTVSFIHPRHDSTELCRRICEAGYGIKSGHMYAYRLCEALGIAPDPGVVRVSAVHTNTVREIEGFLQTIDDLL